MELSFRVASIYLSKFTKEMEIKDGEEKKAEYKGENGAEKEQCVGGSPSFFSF